MTEYTIVEPHFEFFDRHKEDYLTFLEKCTRCCYKSENLIKEGSAEKLLNKVVKEYEHLSVTEHENCILGWEKGIQSLWVYDHFLDWIIEGNPLLSARISKSKPYQKDDGQFYIRFLISGNIRMWMDLLKYYEKKKYTIYGSETQKSVTAEEFHGFYIKPINFLLHKKWPFFFKSNNFELKRDFMIIDDNPLTNNDNLTVEEMKKHMTLTYKLVGSRTMSHQLVRHRLFAFSQESQRYCNYGKKGFQIIVPPSVKDKWGDNGKGFIDLAMDAYRGYLKLINAGVKPEDARGVLPNATKTEVVTTGTLGYWEHVFKHRADNPKAQWEIRELMTKIREHAKTVTKGVF